MASPWSRCHCEVLCLLAKEQPSGSLTLRCRSTPFVVGFKTRASWPVFLVVFLSDPVRSPNPDLLETRRRNHTPRTTPLGVVPFKMVRSRPLSHLFWPAGFTECLAQCGCWFVSVSSTSSRLTAHPACSKSISFSKGGTTNSHMFSSGLFALHAPQE